MEPTRTQPPWMDGVGQLRSYDFPSTGPFVSGHQPTPDGLTIVGWDQNTALPAYRIADPDGVERLVPFTPTVQFSPPGDAARFYVDGFTDAAIKALWREAESSPQWVARITAALEQLPIPHQFRSTGALDPTGRIDPHAMTLGNIRRPSYFGHGPHAEPIAALDERTFTFGFIAPREPYERLHLAATGSLMLRGWFIRGDGIDDGKGGRHRALVVLIAGRSIETTATQHPDDGPCAWDELTRSWIQLTYPNGRTECFGARNWRRYLHDLNRAGFDVMTFDKRGHGISGGLTDSNTGEQAYDIFRALDAFETGEGLVVSTPAGRELTGSASAGLLLDGIPAREWPVIVGGSSQGSMVAAWAMHSNFVENRRFDVDHAPSLSARGYNFKGAMLLAAFSSGLGFRPKGSAVVEGARRSRYNVQTFPSAEVFANLHRWPGLFIARGLWDFAESLEGSLAAYERVESLKEIVAVRGPHGENEWGESNIAHVSARMCAFARAAALGLPASPGAATVRNLKELVASAPPEWSPWSFAPR